ncbi:MAG: hypothetical protein WC718_09670 [Phycisphaerales bacterium]
MDSDPAFATELRRRLHVFCDGIMLVADRADRVRFVLNPSSGEPVLPIHADVLEHQEITLLVPDETDDALQLLCTPTPLDPARAEACDRHLIFFGKPQFPKWALLEVEAVKSTDGVLEGAEFVGPEPLHAAEPALLKLLNADRSLLGAAYQRHGGTTPDEPLAVGVDEWGAWVRARFGAMRLPFATHAPTDAAAREAIGALLHGAPS